MGIGISEDWNEDHLPQAFSNCDCRCHHTHGMKHFVACCWPGKPDLVTRRRIDE